MREAIEPLWNYHCCGSPQLNAGMLGLSDDYAADFRPRPRPRLQAVQLRHKSPGDGRADLLDALAALSGRQCGPCRIRTQLYSHQQRCPYVEDMRVGGWCSCWTCSLPSLETNASFGRRIYEPL